MFFFNYEWNISNDRYLRMLQYNILTGILNKYDNTLLHCIVLAYQNELYPQEFSNYFLSIYVQFGNLILFDNNKRVKFNHKLLLAYSMLDRFKESKNYKGIRNMLDSLSRATGFINENNLDSYIRHTILDSINNNQVILNYDFYTKNNITYIGLFIGDLWNIKNEDDLMMKAFFQHGLFQIIEVKNKISKKTQITVEYDIPPHFIQVKKCNNNGFFLVSSSGTYEGKDISLYSINNGNVAVQDLYNALTEDYHSFAYYTYSENSGQHFSWNYEYANMTQANNERKIPGIINIYFNHEKNNCSVLKHKNDEIFDYIENIYIETAQLQLGLLNSIVINNKKINDENLIRIIKDPVEYYSRNLITTTLLWLPKILQPQKNIFIFEDRPFLFDDNKMSSVRKEYIFLIDKKNESYNINSIFYSEDGCIKKRIL